VEAAGESLKLAVGHPVGVSYGGEELSVGSAQAVGPTQLPSVHRLKLLPVVLHEAEFEDEFAAADEFLVDLLLVGRHRGSIMVIAQ